MPTPSSVTTSTTCPLSICTITSTRLASACLAALVSASRKRGDELVGRLRREHRVDRTGEPHRRLEAQERRGLGRLAQHAPAGARGGPLDRLVQREDRLTDLLDRLVELVDRPGHALGRGVRHVVDARRALQHHPGGEEPLDDEVVQVAGDAIAVLVHRESLVLAACLRQHERDRRLRAERAGEVEDVAGEVAVLVAPHEHEHAEGAVRGAQRGDERGPVAAAAGRRAPGPRSLDASIRLTPSA